jgi:hypothetical protein
MDRVRESDKHVHDPDKFAAMTQKSWSIRGNR